MILPIGHRESSVRRLPWVSFAIIVTCVVAFMATDMEKAYELADPAYSQFEETTEGSGAPRLSPDNPFVRWGLIPAQPRAHTFVTHLFMHAGWLHLLSNLFLFFLAGPPVEDRWGRPLFGAFYLLAGIFAGGTHGWMTSSPELPLVGASGAIAGVLGVFFVRFWATKIRFFYFIFLGFFIRTGTFEAPAWLMLPLWFANELFNIWITATFGIEAGVAYWAHVGGFAFGVLFALMVKSHRLEERFIHAAIEEKVTLLEGNPVIEEAMQAREQGDVEKAYGLLEKASLENSNDPDVAVVFWDTAVRAGRAEAAVPALSRAIRSCVVRGEVEQAGEYWLEMCKWAPSARLDPTALFKLAANLFERGEDTKAARALEQALDPTNSGLGPGLALRIVDLARERVPRVALSAARRALEFPDLHEAKRARILELVSELEASGADSAPMPSSPDQGGDPSAPWEKPDAIVLRDDWDEQEDEKTRGHTASEFEKFNEFVSMARFSVVKVVEAAPTLLADGALQLRLDDESNGRIGYRKINAIAVGKVDGLADRPVVLIDLLLNWNDLDAEELRILRLRSDGFEPSLLLPSAPEASEPLGMFVEELLARSRAKPLPDRDSACGRPLHEFESLEAYQREVLQVEE